MQWPQGKIAQGSLLSLVIRLTALGLGFLQTLILARILGPDRYGIVVAVISVATLSAWIGVAGMNGLAVREIAQLTQRGEHAAERAFIRFALIIVLAGSLVVSGIASFFSITTAGIYLWAFLFAPVIALMLLLRSVALGRDQIVLSQAPLDILRPVLFLAVVAVLAVAGDLSVEAAIAANAWAFIIALFVAFGLAARSGPSDKSASSLRRGLLRDALPFFLSGALASVQAEMMVLMLAMVSSSDQTGLFQVAFRLSTLLLVVQQAINVPLSPRFAQLWERREREELQRLACLAAAVSTGAALTIYVAFFLFSRQITALFGAEFEAAQYSLITLAAGQLVLVAAGPLPTLLNMADRAGSVTFAMALSQALQLGLGLLLVPHYGALGAAIAFAASLIIWAAFMWAAAYRHLGVRISPFHGVLFYLRRGLR